MCGVITIPNNLHAEECIRKRRLILPRTPTTIRLLKSAVIRVRDDSTQIVRIPRDELYVTDEDGCTRSETKMANQGTSADKTGQVKLNEWREQFDGGLQRKRVG